MIITKSFNKFLKYFLTVSITFNFINLASVSAQCNRYSDSLELVKLFNSSDGNSWTNKTNWLIPDKTFDTWFCIKVDENGSVIAITLDHNHLSGNIDNFNFPCLVALYLTGNKLTGSIPNFNNLPKLKTLFLNNNEFTGGIPNFNNLLNLNNLKTFLIP